VPAGFLVVTRVGCNQTAWPGSYGLQLVVFSACDRSAWPRRYSLLEAGQEDSLSMLSKGSLLLHKNSSLSTCVEKQPW